MSRHRIVRAMDYSDEYDGYDDVYGHSVDDETGISPTDASQWIYDRARGQQSISEFIKTNRNIKEEDEEEDEKSNLNEKQRRDSENFQMPVLNDLEKIKLTSCIDEIRNVVGDTFSDKKIVDAVMQHNFDYNTALDSLLNDTSKERTNQPTIRDVSFKIPHNLEKNENHTSIKLDDLIKKNLKNIKNEDDTIEKSKKKFVLPVLKKPQINISQLKINSESNTDNDEINNLKLKVLQKVGEKMKKLNLNDDIVKTDDKLDMIDLTQALETSINISSEKPLKSNNNKFFIPFTDCNIPHRKLPLTERKIKLKKPWNFRLRKSNFAKIMILKLKQNSNGNIRHSFLVKHNITSFSFTSLSPDDAILRHIKT